MWALTLCSLQPPFGAFLPDLAVRNFRTAFFRNPTKADCSRQSHNVRPTCDPSWSPRSCRNLCGAARALVSQAASGRVANARNHVNEAIACRLAPHAPARLVDQANDRYGAELVKVGALIRFAVEGNAAGLRGILGARL